MAFLEIKKVGMTTITFANLIGATSAGHATQPRKRAAFGVDVACLEIKEVGMTTITFAKLIGAIRAGHATQPRLPTWRFRN